MQFFLKYFIQFQLSILLILSFFLISCGREKTLSEQAYQKEQRGDKAEALYEYSLALKVDPDYPFANKRIGILFSESTDSINLAIHHLKKARQGYPEDMELLLKLYDLYIQTGDLNSAKKHITDNRKYLETNSYNVLLDIYNCILNKDKANELASKYLINQSIGVEKKYIYNSIAICLKNQGFAVNAEETIRQK